MENAPLRGNAFNSTLFSINPKFSLETLKKRLGISMNNGLFRCREEEFSLYLTLLFFYFIRAY